jgi:hypothetical protein
LYDVWDLGWQKGSFEGKPNVLPKIILAFEINRRISSGHSRANERFAISRKYTFSFGKRSNLGKDIESWLNRKLTENERKDFDIETMVGANCLLSIVHNEAANGNTYANIQSIMPIMEGMAPMVAENKRGIPEWVQKQIDVALTDDDASALYERIAQQKAEENVPEETAPKINEEDVPF